MLNFYASLAGVSHETVSPASVAHAHYGTRYYRFLFVDLLYMDI